MVVGAGIEMWSLVYAKAKNVTPATAAKVQLPVMQGYGSRSTQTQKLAPCWTIGPRDAETTDGLKAYLEAVDYAFGGYIDYSMLIRICGTNPEAEKRYIPAQCIGCETKRVVGDPAWVLRIPLHQDPSHPSGHSGDGGWRRRSAVGR